MTSFVDDDVVEGVVQAIVPGGAGIVRDANGVVFVRGALPGERVRATIERRQKKVRHASLLAVLAPSPERVKPDCAVHPRCGGCDFLDFSALASASAKTAIVKDALTRVGRLHVDDGVLAPLATPGLEGDGHLRRRASVLVRGGKPTFSAPASHDRVPVDDCPALTSVLRAAIGRIAAAGVDDNTTVRLACDDAKVVAAIEPGTTGAAQRLIDAGVAAGVVDGDGTVVGDGIVVGEVTAGRFAAKSDPAVFTQATRFGGAAIIDAVMRACGRDDDGGQLDDVRVLELFAGAGHITLPLLAAGATVDAVEGAPRSVRYLEQNVGLVDARRALVRRAQIDGALRIDDAKDVRVLVADPPRTGIPDFAKLLAKLPALDRAVLVSCDPATGARDIAVAVAAGFKLVRVAPIDAFPRTSHVEWVATLLRV